SSTTSGMKGGKGPVPVLDDLREVHDVRETHLVLGGRAIAHTVVVGIRPAALRADDVTRTKRVVERQPRLVAEVPRGDGAEIDRRARPSRIRDGADRRSQLVHVRERGDDV